MYVLYDREIPNSIMFFITGKRRKIELEIFLKTDDIVLNRYVSESNKSNLL